MSEPARICRCGTRLARDNAGNQCHACQRAARNRWAAPAPLPETSWDSEELRAALDIRDMGLVMRAFRQHPAHGTDISQEVAACWVGISQSRLSRIEQGGQPFTEAKLARWADVLGIPAHLRWFAAPRTRPGDNQLARVRAPLPEGGDDTHRRDALKLGLLALAPAVLNSVLRGAASDAAEFTRRAEASAVGQGMLDHLELVGHDLNNAYFREPPRDLFAVAYAYRQRVDALLRGPRTLREARELFVYAGMLSGRLAWLADDLGSSVTADAFCVDAVTHAEHAGDRELHAWALYTRATISHDANRPDRALDAALAGIRAAPARHPITVRLHSTAARAYARLGQAEAFETAMAAAHDTYERLPSVTAQRFGAESTLNAASALRSHSATSAIWLGRFDAAKRAAETALNEYDRAAPGDLPPARRAIAQIDLGLALNGLGEPDEAARLGVVALSANRVTDPVLRRAGDLQRALVRPGRPRRAETAVFTDAFRQATATVQASRV